MPPREPRSMPFLILLLFLLPFLEIYVLITVGGIIGVLPTIALVLGLSVFGAYLLRQQGLATLFKAQEAMTRGEMPVGAMLDGLGLTVAAALLITPGLITDTFGFVLLIPQFRTWFMRGSLGWLLNAHVFGPAAPPKTGPKPKRPAGDDVIEGDFRRLDD
jgi:UPF0716 protein FxsA